MAKHIHLLLICGLMLCLQLGLTESVWAERVPCTRRPCYCESPLYWSPALKWGSTLFGWAFFTVIMALSGWACVKKWGWRSVLPMILIFLCLVTIDSYSSRLTRHLLLKYLPSNEPFKLAAGFLTFTARFATIGIPLIAVTIGLLDDWRKAVKFLVIVAIIGLTTDVVKVSIGRQRPADPDTQEVYWFGHPLGFRWFPLHIHGPLAGIQSSRYQSFPSGHVITAFAESTVLSMMYPAGAPLFVFLAAGASIHRLYFGSHYFSDVFIAALLGMVLADWFYRRREINRFSEAVVETLQHAYRLRSPMPILEGLAELIATIPILDKSGKRILPATKHKKYHDLPPNPTQQTDSQDEKN